MTYHVTGSSLEWEFTNFDPFTRAYDFHWASLTDPPMSAWYGFTTYESLGDL